MSEHTVSVTALKSHTNHGKAYAAGDMYDVPAADVENLVAQGMAKPSAEAKADAKAAKATATPDTTHKT